VRRRSHRAAGHLDTRFVLSSGVPGQTGPHNRCRSVLRDVRRGGSRPSGRDPIGRGRSASPAGLHAERQCGGRRGGPSDSRRCGAGLEAVGASRRVHRHSGCARSSPRPPRHQGRRTHDRRDHDLGQKKRLPRSRSRDDGRCHPPLLLDTARLRPSCSQRIPSGSPEQSTGTPLASRCSRAARGRRRTAYGRTAGPSSPKSQGVLSEQERRRLR